MSERRFGRTLGGVSLLGLHGVWCSNYRRRILGGRLAARCGVLLEQIAAEHGGPIAAKDVMPDHGHLVVGVGPTDAAAHVVRAFKGGTAGVLGQEFPHLRKSAKVVWSPSYLAASVGYVSESTLRRYLERQWDAVMAR
jgi:putative transposase